MNKCDEMFYETYPDAVWQDDTAITVWRDCWQVCTERMIYQMIGRTKLFTEGMRNEYADNQQVESAASICQRIIKANVLKG